MSPKFGVRQEQKNETRRALIEAARKCFAKVGYAKATIPEIVRTAGVAQGTFYVHFSGKEALVETMLAKFNATLALRLAPILAESSGLGGDERERPVRAAAQAFLSHLESDPSFVAWYVERIAAGLPANVLRDGVNPPAFELLVDVLTGASGLTGKSPKLVLAAQGLLALWIRIGLQYVLGADPTREMGNSHSSPPANRQDAEDVLVTMTVGAVSHLIAQLAPRIP